MNGQHSAGVIAHGLRAVAQHLFDHQLPSPLSIQFNRERDAILVHVDSTPASIELWVASLHLDHVEESRRGHIAYVTSHGRLPDSGVRVDVLSVHFDALPVLQVVGS